MMASSNETAKQGKGIAGKNGLIHWLDSIVYFPRFFFSGIMEN